MSTRGMSTQRDTGVIKAQLVAAIERAWKDWQSFIAEKQDEIARKSAQDSADPLTVASGIQPQRTVRANLPATVRQELNTIFERRRIEAQREAENAARLAGEPPPDAEQVLAMLVQQIADELEGRAHPQGLALVWFDNQMVEFDQRAVRKGTSDVDYAAFQGGSAQQQRQRMLIGLFAMVAVAIVMIVFLFRTLVPSGPATPQATTASGPISIRVGGAASTVWTVNEVTVGETSAPPAAVVYGYPLQVCVTPEQQTAVLEEKRLTLLGGPSQVRSYNRRYTLNDSADQHPLDLIILDCRANPQAPVAYARMESSNNEAVERIDPKALSLVFTAGQDTSTDVAAGQMLVYLIVTEEDLTQDAVLVSPSGDRLPPLGAAESVANGFMLTFSVPATQEQREFGLEVNHAGKVPQVLRVMINPPVNREYVLRNGLTVQPGNITVETRTDGTYLRVPLTMQLDPKIFPVPLQLSANDLTLSGPLAAGLPRWDAPKLNPGEQVVSNVEINIGPDVTSGGMSIGKWSATLTW